MNTNSKIKIKNTDLDSVVKSLTKAALGSKASKVDFNNKQEVDKYISDMLIDEAKKKEKLYKEHGTKAYLFPIQNFERTNRPNQQFLKNIIKQTDSHNRYLLKQEKSKETNRLIDASNSKKDLGRGRLFSQSLNVINAPKRKKDLNEGSSPTKKSQKEDRGFKTKH